MIKVHRRIWLFYVMRHAGAMRPILLTVHRCTRARMIRVGNVNGKRRDGAG
jgi:hypothetical protein